MTNIVEKIADSVTGMSLAIAQLGCKRNIKDNEQEQVSELFDSEKSLTKTQKSLLDSKIPEYKEVVSVLRKAYRFYRDHTVEYPLTNCRIIKRDNIEHVDSQLRWYQGELANEVEKLWANFDAIKESMKTKLGTLYVEEEYPVDVRKEFAITWSFPDINPAEGLAKLNAEIYNREITKMRAAVAEAAVNAEKAFGKEMRQSVQRMLKSLDPGEGKRPKMVRPAAFDRALEFCDRFRMMNIHTDSELTSLIDRLEMSIKGIDIDGLNKDSESRNGVTASLEDIVREFDEHVVERIGGLIEL